MSANTASPEKIQPDKSIGQILAEKVEEASLMDIVGYTCKLIAVIGLSIGGITLLFNMHKEDMADLHQTATQVQEMRAEIGTLTQEVKALREAINPPVIPPQHQEH